MALAFTLAWLTGCAHSDADAGKKKRRTKAHAKAPAEAPAPAAEQEAPPQVAPPRALGADLWQVEAEGRSLEEAAQRAVHAAVAWCAERRQVPIPDSDAQVPTAHGQRMTLNFHCMPLPEAPAPLPPTDFNPMPLDD